MTDRLEVREYIELRLGSSLCSRRKSLRTCSFRYQPSLCYVYRTEQH